jgi:hypothetical protein
MIRSHTIAFRCSTCRHEGSRTVVARWPGGIRLGSQQIRETIEHAECVICSESTVEELETERDPHYGPTPEFTPVDDALQECL